MTKNLTIKELAALMGEEYQTVSALAKILTNQGVFKIVGSKPAEGGRGKPSQIFEVPNEVELVFWQDGAESVEIPTQKEFDGNGTENRVDS